MATITSSQRGASAHGGILVAGVKRALANNATNLAAAIAYYAFLAIPAALLVAVGAFSLLAGPHAVQTITTHLSSVMPASAVTLLGQSLRRTSSAQSGGVVMIVVGFLLAVWTLSGAMQTMMWALNGVYEREETRGFVRKRLIAFAMIACAVASFALVFVLLIMGPHMTGWIGSAVGNETVVRWVWWTVQWPILLVGLMAAFAVILFLAPNVDQPSWRLFSPGALVAIVIWLVGSGAFAFYTSQFASYNKTWGSLAAVIIMLTWLWLSALALIVGGAINAESQRRRQSTGG